MKAIQYMHSLKIAHCDIKPCKTYKIISDLYPNVENILLRDPKNFTSVVLCDFGLSRQYHVNPLTYELKAKGKTGFTSRYRAPEQHKS